MTNAPSGAAEQPWPDDRLDAMIAFYGDPRSRGAPAVSGAWQKAHLVTIEPPYQLFYAGSAVSRIAVHHRCESSLYSILMRISDRFDATDRARYGLDEFGGVFNFRVKRGGTSLSTHAFAAAIDLAVANNPLGAAYGSLPDMMPIEVVGFFEDEGWEWGGHWSRPDAMHFQAARSTGRRATAPLGGGAYRWADWFAVQIAGAPARPSLVPEGSGPREVRYVQTMLRALGYVEVGEVDGIMGSMTRGAILAFRADNDLALTDGAGQPLLIDEALLVALPRASPRPMSEARTDASAREVRAELPEARSNHRGGLAGIIMAAGGALSAFGGWVIESVGEVRETAAPLLALLGDVPWWAYAGVLAGVGVWLYLNGRQGERAAVAAWQTGARR